MANDEKREADPMDPDLSRGLIHIHEKLGDRILAHQRLSAHVYALTETLIANGLLRLHDFEVRKASTEQAMAADAETRLEGARVLGDDRDKYGVEGPKINCAERIHLCKAACCRLSFYLSKQDLRENVVRWDVTHPYHILHRADGWCHHCDETTKRCDVHAQRPLVCRGYDCREDPRIWEDFEKAIPNPSLNGLR